VSPSKREREYARQRYSKWQQRQETRAERRRRLRQTALAVGAAFAVVALVAAVFWVVRDGGADDAAPDGTQASEPQATSTDGATDGSTGGPTPGSEPVPDPALAEGRTWTSTLATSEGDVTLELFGDLAPQSVASFVHLAQDDFFAGTSCHRLTTEGIFVLQCGDPTGTGTGGPGYEWGPVENAPGDDLYPAGTLAMARQANRADSQGSQFFIVYEDSTIPSDSAGGYSVFGRVTGGLDIVQRIAEGGLADDGVAPRLPISIEGVTVQ
jgi:peptidyl-prolyl cis-trans isomerase B (cyclophilin B)